MLVYFFLIASAILSYSNKKLTLMGAITGAIVGMLIYEGAGVYGLVMLALFFIAGSWATAFGQGKKQIIGFAEKNKGRRTTGQVLANGGVAALLGALAWYSPGPTIIAPLMIAGSLAAATADTLSSELGMVYGRKFFNILTFEKDTRGFDGVVSLEGTLIGLVGAALIAMIYALNFGWGVSFLWIVIAGFTGNLIDSVLGATLERKGIIGNNMVNFFNTLTGALVSLGLSMIFY